MTTARWQEGGKVSAPHPCAAVMVDGAGWVPVSQPLPAGHGWGGPQVGCQVRRRVRPQCRGPNEAPQPERKIWLEAPSPRPIPSACKSTPTPLVTHLLPQPPRDLPQPRLPVGLFGLFGIPAHTPTHQPSPRLSATTATRALTFDPQPAFLLLAHIPQASTPPSHCWFQVPRSPHPCPASPGLATQPHKS